MSAPKMTIEYVAIEKLNPATYNPRIMPKEDMQNLQTSIETFGFVENIIVNKRNMVIVGGHQRVEAAKAIGESEVPVYFVDLDEDREKALNIALNRIVGEFDMSKLPALVQELPSDLRHLTGISDEELHKMLEVNVDPEVKEVEAPQPPKNPQSKLGEIYQCGDHRVMCGDATNPEHIKALCGEHKADLMFTDPPYGVEYVGKTKDALKIQNDDLGDEGTQALVADMLRAAPMKAGAAFYICSPAGLTETYFRLAVIEAGYMLKQCIVWVKNHFVMGRQDYQWKHESILYGWKGGEAHSFYGGRGQDTVWEVDRPSASKDHPTMKPLPLIGKAIRNSSKAGDLVIDFFGGSGSTLIAAAQLERTCFTMEIDPKYVDVILARWKKLTGEEPVLLKPTKPKDE